MGYLYFNSSRSRSGDPSKIVTMRSRLLMTLFSYYQQTFSPSSSLSTSASEAEQLVETRMAEFVKVGEMIEVICNIVKSNHQDFVSAIPILHQNALYRQIFDIPNEW